MSDTEQRREFSQAKREKLAKSGAAMADGSFPIVTVEDLKNAIQAVGRASDPAAAKAHIKKRAAALKATDLIPEDWRAFQPGEPDADDLGGPSDNDDNDADDEGGEKCVMCGGSGQTDLGMCPECEGSGEPKGEGLMGGQQNAADEELERRRHDVELREGMFEFRSIPSFELRDISDGMVRFSGYASTTEQPYEIADFTETIARGAFRRTLAESPDVRLNINHGVGGQLPIARTKNGTLTLSEDARGLKVDADLDPSRSDVKDAVAALRRGDADEMSFAFRATQQEWDEGLENRLIREVTLHRGDVSIVTTGANPDTAAVIRSDDAGFELRIAEDRVGKKHSAATVAEIDSAIEHLQKLKAEAETEPDAEVLAPAEEPGEAFKVQSNWGRSYIETIKAKRARLL